MARSGVLITVSGLLIASVGLRAADGDFVSAAFAAVTEPDVAAQHMIEDLQCPPAQEAEAVLAAFAERDAALSFKEQELAERQAQLAVVEAELTNRLSELAAAEESLQLTLSLAERAAETDVGRLTTVYENMKPRDAAALFSTMAPDFAAGFIGRMNPESAAAILTGLEPDIAYAISVVLAGRNADVPTE